MVQWGDYEEECYLDVSMQFYESVINQKSLNRQGNLRDLQKIF